MITEFLEQTTQQIISNINEIMNVLDEINLIDNDGRRDNEINR